MVDVQGDADLFEIVDALDATGRLVGLLHGCQQEPTRTPMMAITTRRSINVKVLYLPRHSNGLPEEKTSVRSTTSNQRPLRQGRYVAL